MSFANCFMHFIPESLMVQIGIVDRGLVIDVDTTTLPVLLINDALLRADIWDLVIRCLTSLKEKVRPTW